jgi:hypothetical protein
LLVVDADDDIGDDGMIMLMMVMSMLVMISEMMNVDAANHDDDVGR